jgi:uncharacterized membrane protein
MKIIITKPHWQVITLGLLAGMRSMSAPAISSRILSRHHSKALKNSPLNFMQSGTTANVLSGLAIGEFVGDKMPSAPNRISAAGLIGRCISGGIAGAGIYKASGGNLYFGALLGSATAIAATYGSFFLRKSIVKHAHLIDPIVGTIEDAIVLGASLGLAETA